MATIMRQWERRCVLLSLAMNPLRNGAAEPAQETLPELDGLIHASDPDPNLFVDSFSLQVCVGYCGDS